MASRKIIWSDKARIKLIGILEFYSERNKNKDYSKKLFLKINKELKILVKQPCIGIKTEMEPVRGLIIDDYILFYECSNDFIIVHTIWDCRQNPEDLKII
jgi:plasmid stabilization system protein ParE